MNKAWNYDFFHATFGNEWMNGSPLLYYRRHRRHRRRCSSIHLGMEIMCTCNVIWIIFRRVYRTSDAKQARLVRALHSGYGEWTPKVIMLAGNHWRPMDHDDRDDHRRCRCRWKLKCACVCWQLAFFMKCTFAQAISGALICHRRFRIWPKIVANSNSTEGKWNVFAHWEICWRSGCVYLSPSITWHMTKYRLWDIRRPEASSFEYSMHTELDNVACKSKHQISAAVATRR